MNYCKQEIDCFKVREIGQLGTEGNEICTLYPFVSFEICTKCVHDLF